LGADRVGYLHYGEVRGELAILDPASHAMAFSNSEKRVEVSGGNSLTLEPSAPKGL
jgi:hypothetical protein